MSDSQSIKDLREDSIPGFFGPTGERASCAEGLTGPLFSDRASLLFRGGVCGWALGKEGESAHNLNRNLGGQPLNPSGLGCLEEFVEAGGGLWWGTGGQAQMRENLADQ